VRQQYSRFCTIFETIVLGRYLNQVQQCEPDLDFLTSTSSLIKPVWFYTLLASALDHQIQDSNRKYIGNWILRSQLRVDDHDEFIHFLQETLLPWAMQGYLFTSSLRYDDNAALLCRHGDNLAAYLTQLLGRTDLVREDIVDAMLDNVLRKANNNFAYAMVYIFEGLGRALESENPPQLTHSHLEKANRMVVWTSLLPEAARDYILSRLWKMCYDHRSTHQSEATSQVIEDSAGMWEKTLLKAQNPEDNRSAQLNGSVSSLSPARSRRDLNEAETINKCSRVMEHMDTTDGLVDSAELVAQLEDIWSDLEYLEFPKNLLTVMPNVLLHHRLAEIMQQDDVSSDSREQIEKMIRELLKQSDSKAYLLYPLLQRIRHNFMHKTTSPEFLEIEDFVIHAAEKPPAPTVDALLEDATVSLISAISSETSVFNHDFYGGKRESYGFAAFLDMVSRIQSVQDGAPERIAQRILQRWMRQKTPPPTVSPWKTVLQLQVLLLCLEQYVPAIALTEAERVLKNLHYILSIEPLPTYRYLLEWMIARIHLHHTELRSILLAELRVHDHHSNPKFLASLMKIGVSVAKAPSSREDFGSELMAIFATLAASSKVVIRHEAQWQIPALLDQAAAKQWDSISNDTTFRALDGFVRSLQRFGDPPLDRRIDKLDPVADHNLTHLVEGPWYELDNVERRQTNHECFVSLYASDAQLATIETAAVSCMPLGDAMPTTRSPSSTSKDLDASKQVLQNIETINKALGSGSNSTILQTKGAAYLESSSKRHSNLLVIASLIDNPYNLGGLSRVSEIFGAGGLYMSNITVTSNREFSGVSVSSHLHLPLHSLQASHLQSFLVAKKQNEGFTVCGIEQTDRSWMLGSAECILPEKCILVMGSEKEGIPALILSECDVLIEIPQVGITRSLNVQTAAGIVLCEYAKQHKL
jgi:tRNA guanosine-2'-O-methyltransferase